MIRQYFSYYISVGTSSLWRTSVQPLSSFRFASVLPSDALTLPSVEGSMFACFLTFLDWDLSLSQFFTLCCQLYFIFRCHLFPFKNSRAFSYYLSFLPPDEACGRNVVYSTVYFSSVCCFLNYDSSILFILHKCRNFFSLAHFCAAIVVFSIRFSAAF